MWQDGEAAPQIWSPRVGDGRGKLPQGPQKCLLACPSRESHGGASAAPDSLPTPAPHPKESDLGSGEGGVLQSLPCPPNP